MPTLIINLHLWTIIGKPKKKFRSTNCTYSILLWTINFTDDSWKCMWQQLKWSKSFLVSNLPILTSNQNDKIQVQWNSNGDFLYEERPWKSNTNNLKTFHRKSKLKVFGYLEKLSNIFLTLEDTNAIQNFIFVNKCVE